MIAPRESPTVIDKRYETRSAIYANCIILSNSNCLIGSTLWESHFIAVVSSPLFKLDLNGEYSASHHLLLLDDFQQCVMDKTNINKEDLDTLTLGESWDPYKITLRLMNSEYDISVEDMLNKPIEIYEMQKI
jgi:hypothetical protein